MRLVGDDELARSSVVANRAMNRTRGLSGRDGYPAALGLDIIELRPGSWLDLCCGSGRALLEAAAILGPHVPITGVDLVDFFAGPAPAQVELTSASVTDWQPSRTFDLITCVHGLHYVGDKLAVLTKAASWLTPDGLLVANFDVESARQADGTPMGPRLRKALRQEGFQYDGRSKRIRRHGHATPTLPFTYLGADEQAGPNYTGQPAVHSYYTYQG
jgi:ubiquinone/menaquinone biosynthesis C-methylase UbiE